MYWEPYNIMTRYIAVFLILTRENIITVESQLNAGSLTDVGLK